MSKYGLVLSAMAALCLMACGEDSSSSASIDEDSELSSSSEISESSSINLAEGLGKSSSSGGKSATQSSSSRSGISSTSTEKNPDSSDDNEEKACSFGAKEKVWKFSYNGKDSYNNSAKIKTAYEIDNENLVIRDTIRYTGKQASCLCKSSEGLIGEYTSEDGSFSATTSCDDSVVVVISNIREEDYFDTYNLKEVHANVKKACDVAVNGGHYDVVSPETETCCSFAFEDSIWRYSYIDEYGKDGDSVVVSEVFLLNDELKLVITEIPMQHAECVAEKFADISLLSYCGADGLIEISSSNIKTDKEQLFTTEKRSCMEKLPVPDKDDPDAEEVILVSGMVSCIIPGIESECIEFPAGSPEAIALKEQCETDLEGTLGTGCE